MAIITKTYLDTIVLQFSTGAEHQLKPPGQLEGAHFVEVEYFVDDSNGAILGRTNKPGNGFAQVLDPAKVGEFVGAQSAAMAAQISQLGADLKSTGDARDALTAELGEREAELTAASGERDTLKSQLDEANGKLAALETECAALKSQAAPAA